MTIDNLTLREKEIIEEMGLGLNTAEIADNLFVTERTIKAHKSNIQKKLEAKNCVQSVWIYLTAKYAERKAC